MSLRFSAVFLLSCDNFCHFLCDNSRYIAYILFFFNIIVNELCHACVRRKRSNMDFSKNQSSKTQTQSQKAIEQAAKTAQKSSHKVELDHLHAMSVTGVEDVPTFTDKTVVIRLKGETLTVSGQNLAVKILTSPRENCKSKGKSTLSNTRRRPPLLRLQNAFSNDSIVSRGKRKSAGNLLCALLCGRACRRLFRVVVHKKSGLFRARPSRPFRYGRHWCDFYMLH